MTTTPVRGRLDARDRVPSPRSGTAPGRREARQAPGGVRNPRWGASSRSMDSPATTTTYRRTASTRSVRAHIERIETRTRRRAARGRGRGRRAAKTEAGGRFPSAAAAPAVHLGSAETDPAGSPSRDSPAISHSARADAWSARDRRRRPRPATARSRSAQQQAHRRSQGASIGADPTLLDPVRPGTFTCVFDAPVFTVFARSGLPCHRGDRWLVPTRGSSRSISPRTC